MVMPKSPCMISHDLEVLETRLSGYGAMSALSEVSLNEVFRSHLRSGGSRTRAILALRCARDLGLPDSVRFSIATAVELLHQASLIHDDLQDRDPVRRGQRSVWSSVGVSTAICLGDELIAAAFGELAELPSLFSKQLPRMVKLMSRAVSAMSAGQAIDCRWSADSSISIAEYEKIVQLKSGPLLGLPVAMAIAASGGQEKDIEKSLDVAASIGIAYQLADDLEDKAEDYGQRLNGYWVIERNSEPGSEISGVLRKRFVLHLDQALADASSLPKPCLMTFLELIDRLREAYPALQKVA